MAQSITDHGSYYSYPLTASITMGNEGEKSAIPYVYKPPIDLTVHGVTPARSASERSATQTIA